MIKFSIVQFADALRRDSVIRLWMPCLATKQPTTNQPRNR